MSVNWFLTTSARFAWTTDVTHEYISLVIQHYVGPPNMVGGHMQHLHAAVLARLPRQLVVEPTLKKCVKSLRRWCSDRTLAKKPRPWSYLLHPQVCCHYLIFEILLNIKNRIRTKFERRLRVIEHWRDSQHRWAGWAWAWYERWVRRSRWALAAPACCSCWAGRRTAALRPGCLHIRRILRPHPPHVNECV